MPSPAAQPIPRASAKELRAHAAELNRVRARRPAADMLDHGALIAAVREEAEGRGLDWLRAVLQTAGCDTLSAVPVPVLRRIVAACQPA